MHECYFCAVNLSQRPLYFIHTGQMRWSWAPTPPSVAVNWAPAKHDQVKKRALRWAHDFMDVSWNHPLQKNYKNVKGLISMAAFGDHCVLATNQEESNSYLLLLCNALGTPIDTKQVYKLPAATKYNICMFKLEYHPSSQFFVGFKH